ncbi:MAG: 2-hydroxymuconate tautomerase family protein [Candidatus Limnocylindrales bacterium]
MPRLIVQMIEGRTVEQKRELARRLSETVIDLLKVDPETVTVFIEEVPPENFARAGMLALDRRAAKRPTE